MTDFVPKSSRKIPDSEPDPSGCKVSFSKVSYVKGFRKMSKNQSVLTKTVDRDRCVMPGEKLREGIHFSWGSFGDGGWDPDAFLSGAGGIRGK